MPDIKRTDFRKDFRKNFTELTFGRAGGLFDRISDWRSSRTFERTSRPEEPSRTVWNALVDDEGGRLHELKDFRTSEQQE